MCIRDRVETVRVLDAKVPETQGIPGKLPRIAIGKLAIKEAWDIERTEGRYATAEEVMTILQERAKAGKNPVLNGLGKDGEGVEWKLENGDPKTYTLRMCSTAIKKWISSRSEK